MTFSGIITQYLGFRAMFWFLFILGIPALSLIILLLPETLQSIAGNGSVRLVGFQQPLVWSFRGQPGPVTEPLSNAPKRKAAIQSIVAPLRFLFEKDVFVSLFFGSIVYTVRSMARSVQPHSSKPNSTSTISKSVWHFCPTELVV